MRRSVGGARMRGALDCGAPRPRGTTSRDHLGPEGRGCGSRSTRTPVPAAAWRPSPGRKRSPRPGLHAVGHGSRDPRPRPGAADRPGTTGGATGSPERAARTPEPGNAREAGNTQEKISPGGAADPGRHHRCPARGAGRRVPQAPSRTRAEAGLRDPGAAGVHQCGGPRGRWRPSTGTGSRPRSRSPRPSTSRGGARASWPPGTTTCSASRAPAPRAACRCPPRST